jgi:deoxyribodipyrimidine photolyase-related protein
MNAIVLFPHQLFRQSIPGVDAEIYLVEEPLYFLQYNFHPLKRAYHRATMKVFEAELKESGSHVHYIEANQPQSETRVLVEQLASKGIKYIHLFDVVDDWLEKSIMKSSASSGVEIKWHHSPQFMESKKEVLDYSGGKKRLFHADFYKKQRLKHRVLIDTAGNPLGGQWSFDEDNRKRYPAGAKPPVLPMPESSPFWDEAVEYVRKNFDNPYELPLGDYRYPITRLEAFEWLENFLMHRLKDFGPYEDAIVKGETFLHHSVLTPMLNVGLITPREVVDRTLQFAAEHEVPMNSLEGFIRQVLGWREYIRMVYEWKGRIERTRNYWGFKRKIPLEYWMGTTGIEPVDDTIRKVRETGYCHHIERLMIIGNFMLLNEFDPDEVYRWFMELFIDAYDWVMVPNVYGMSQFADGGLMATKPYISGSNYVMKMSNHTKGPWQETWDILFWRFIDNHRSFFQGNPRLNMMVHTLDKMSDDKLRRIRSFELSQV